jgi:glucose/arabinose dehydrogenase
MRRTRPWPFLLSTLLAIVAVVAVVTVARTQAPPPGDVAKTYESLCANCHGTTLGGGQGPSLVDGTWIHGDTDGDLTRVIRDGVPTTPMASFRASLTDQQIRALVIYIREAQERARSGSLGSSVLALPDRLASERHAFRVETVATGLDTPWGIEFLPGGDLLVSERPGRLRIIRGGQVQASVTGVPQVWARQDGGLMDIALHPQFAQNGWVYLALSEPGGDAAGASSTRVLRGRLRDGALVEQQTLFKPAAALYWNNNTHFGARLLFDGQGDLFFSIGDRGHMADAQDLASPYGKLHRIRDDGTVPPDNPFVGRTGAVESIWSYGHRNQQGLALEPGTRALWATEHGPRGGDELNRIEKAANYGWPVVTFGMNDNGTPITDRTSEAGMQSPVVHWTPSIAVCGITFYAGDRFERWRGDLLVSALGGQQLRRLEMRDGRVTHQEVLMRGYGRIRDVVIGPDGLVYLAMNDPGRIVRLVPTQP